MSDPTIEIPPPDPKGSGAGRSKDSGPADPSEPSATIMVPGGTSGLGAISMPGLSGQDEAVLADALKSLPNYDIEKKLGEGGMGSVYRARQRTLNRTVAVKVLPQRLSADKRYTARLLREAQVLAKINHANVIACYDVGEHTGLL
ncbi:MAG: protein kinase, partial [Planctomycetota bacterium]|nr:protein kinase [Planctomycetota bacterium]